MLLLLVLNHFYVSTFFTSMDQCLENFMIEFKTLVDLPTLLTWPWDSPSLEIF